MLRINDVALYEKVRYRVLDVTECRYAWIDIDSANAFPEPIQISEVQKAILAETLSVVEDPFVHLATLLPEQGSSAQKVRDKRLAVIDALIHQPGIYYRSGRGTLVLQAVKKYGTAK